MASPGRDFDAARKYKVVLSERLKNEDSSAEKYINSIVHLEPSLKTPSSVRTAQIKTAPDDADDVSLHLSGARSEETYIYGGEHGPTRTLVLLFDSSTQTFTLDSVDAEYTFAHEEAAPSSASGSGDEGTGPDFQASRAAAAAAAPPADGEADPDNPYDWRHFLKARSKSASPTLDSFDPLHLDALGVGIAFPSHHGGYSASQPGATQTGLSPSPDPPPVRRKKTFSPNPAAAAANPLRTAAKPRRAPPKQTRRQASTPPSEPEEVDLAAVSRGASPEGLSAAPTPARHSDPEPEEDSDSDGAGGLEIVEDGAKERRRGRFAHRQFLAGAGDGPISLRSAANSRSPAMEGLGRHGVAGEAGNGGWKRESSSDEDVEKMLLESSIGEAAGREGGREGGGREDGGGGGADQDEDMDDADGLEEEFARALEEGAMEDEDEKDPVAAPVAGYAEDSSSESEEE